MFTLRSREELCRNLTNWGGAELPLSSIDKLTVGDCVRLVLADPNSGLGWEQIYFEISKIDYYKKGKSSSPRKFEGIAMDTYRLDHPLRYVQTGEKINFQRRNIVEIPSWSNDRLNNKAGEQAGKDFFEREKGRMYTAERLQWEYYCDKLRDKLRNAKNVKKASKSQ